MNYSKRLIPLLLLLARLRAAIAGLAALVRAAHFGPPSCCRCAIRRPATVGRPASSRQRGAGPAQHACPPGCPSARLSVWPLVTPSRVRASARPCVRLCEQQRESASFPARRRRRRVFVVQFHLHCFIRWAKEQSRAKQASERASERTNERRRILANPIELCRIIRRTIAMAERGRQQNKL